VTAGVRHLIRPILAFVVILAGCGQEETPLKVDLGKRESVSRMEATDVITYAYLPQYSHTVSYQRHHLIVEYLQNETGLHIKQIYPGTFDNHMQMVGRGEIDISYSNPFIYAKIAHRHNTRAFARVIESGNRTQFRGQIICRADNPRVAKLADCRGKSWIAVDPSSAGGYLYPLGHFISHGLKKEDFSEITFSPGPGGKQENVVLAVHAGKYDVGTIREGTLEVVAGKIDPREIRVIANTRWYPGWVYAARHGLDREVVKKIAAALLKLGSRPDQHQPILAAAHFTGLMASSDSDFDPIRELVKTVGISLEE
jgi:phosphate/phosphite/phosphonate ABC transporter binding protein